MRVERLKVAPCVSKPNPGPKPNSNPNPNPDSCPNQVVPFVSHPNPKPSPNPNPNQVVSCVFKPGLFQPHLVNQEGARRLSGKFRALLS